MKENEGITLELTSIIMSGAEATVKSREMKKKKEIKKINSKNNKNNKQNLNDNIHFTYFVYEEMTCGR